MDHLVYIVVGSNGKAQSFRKKGLFPGDWALHFSSSPALLLPKAQWTPMHAMTLTFAVFTHKKAELGPRNCKGYKIEHGLGCSQNFKILTRTNCIGPLESCYLMRLQPKHGDGCPWPEMVSSSGNAVPQDQKAGSVFPTASSGGRKGKQTLWISTVDLAVFSGYSSLACLPFLVTLKCCMDLWNATNVKRT